MKERLIEKQGFCKGFTLVELSLSLVLIAVISLIITLLIINVLSSYRRGLTLNQINTAGVDLVDDMRSAVQRSSTRPIVEKCKTEYGDQGNNAVKECENRGGREFLIATKKAEVRNVGIVPVMGAFCTGTYSYIWNSGYFFTQENDVMNVGKLKLVYSDGTEEVEGEDFKLLKIRDNSRAVCVAANEGNFNESTIDISTSGGKISEEPIDLLGTEDLGLALYDLTATTSAEGGEVAVGSLLYSVSFVLGTVQGGININSSGNFCATPNDYANQSFDYCSINKFNFAVRATGGR